MEKRRGNQAMGIAALFIAVIGLSLGFAAFSNTLTIRSTATVVPANTELNIDFAVYQNSAYVTTAQSGDLTVTPTKSVNTIVASDAIIDNSSAGAPVLRNLHATFTEPGQYVEYVVYAYQVGHLAAYLKSITFDETTNAKGCTIATTLNGSAVATDDRATQNLVTAVCPSLTIEVKVEDTASTPTTVQSLTDTSVASISSNNKITTTTDTNPMLAHKVTVRLSYKTGDPTVYVDGPVDVVYPDIVLTYSSAN